MRTKKPTGPANASPDEEPLAQQLARLFAETSVGYPSAEAQARVGAKLQLFIKDAAPKTTAHRSAAAGDSDNGGN